MPKANKKHPSKPIIILHTIPGIANIIGNGHIMTTIRKINPKAISAIFFIIPCRIFFHLFRVICLNLYYSTLRSKTGKLRVSSKEAPTGMFPTATPINHVPVTENFADVPPSAAPDPYLCVHDAPTIPVI